MRTLTRMSLLAAAALTGAAASAQTIVINFNSLADGATLGAQFAAQGVTFSPNAFTGPNTLPGGDGTWASNTDLTAVDLNVADPDVGALGDPGLVSDVVIRSFGGYSIEDGDPSVLMTFAQPVSEVRLTFAGLSSFAPLATATRLLALDGGTGILASVLANQQATVSQQRLILTYPAGTTRVAIVPGLFSDYVAFDDLQFTIVPEPSAWGLWIGAVALFVGWAARRRRS